VKIIHVADTHLGRRRLDGRLPEADFARAFDDIAGEAIVRGADVLLVAGDLFDRPVVDPPELRQAQRVLGKLKDAGIPVVAIAGNHDKALINSDEPTWLDYLAEDDLLILLSTRFGPEGPRLDAWNRETKRGAWIDLGGVRFTGAGYLGAATPHKFRQIVERLVDGLVHVVLLHAGPQYFVGEGGGFGREDLAFAESRVAYLALGHIHKPMLHGGWACNPGSPENCELDESHYDFDAHGHPCPRGYAWVEIDPAGCPPLKRLEIRTNRRRPVAHLTLDCTSFGNKLKDGGAALASKACALIAEQHLPGETAVVLRLVGKLNLSRIALDLEVAGEKIREEAGVAAVALDPTGLNLGGLGAGSPAGSESMTREAIERAAIAELVAEDRLWGLDADRGRLADLFFEIKEAIRQGKTSEEVTEKVQGNCLVDRIVEAKQAALAGPVPGGDVAAAGGGKP
jgi:DNA repair exonuclease SbcCD nuclease subunit